ncbi:MAG TPA: hypothetical protein VFP65_21570 [Anaeromyxobacteraceae bacterium]|nr:hypothetical protein [Anaeromyxobacteraceae bacterium]
MPGAIVLLAPVFAAAQLAPVTNTPLPLPKALVFPNYDAVVVGKEQALEGGAYIARASDASANFYNPAGLVQSEKTALSASSAGYVYTKLTSTLSGESISSTKIDSVPGYIGAVTEMPFSDARNVRFGLSITRAVNWSPGPIDQRFDATALGFDRVNYSTAASFQTQVYQVAAAWAPVEDHSIRLGLGVGLAQTSYNSNTTVSGALTSEGQPSQFMQTIRSNGTDSALLFTVGAQWDVARGVTVGMYFRPPGLELWNSSLVTTESANIGATSSSGEYFRDEGGIFRYKLPLEAGIGAAYSFGVFELEGDLRYHEAVAQYTLYQSNVPFQVLTASSNAPNTITTASPPLVKYAAKRVFNVALGGRARIGHIATAHAGFNTAMSPVGDPDNSPLRASDLFGFTGGVDFQFKNLGFSLGAGYQFGKTAAQTSILGNTTIGQAEISLQSISVFYAISYEF